MAANDYILAPIGYEDFLSGQGTLDIPTSGGGTRTINAPAAYFAHKDLAHTRTADMTFSSGADLNFSSGAGLVLNSGATLSGAGTINNTGTVTLAGASGKTLTVGVSGTSAGAVVQTVYGKGLFVGDLAASGDLTIGGASEFVGAITAAAASFSGVVTLAKASGTALDVTADINVDGTATLANLDVAGGGGPTYIGTDSTAVVRIATGSAAETYIGTLAGTGVLTIASDTVVTADFRVGSSYSVDLPTLTLGDSSYGGSGDLIVHGETTMNDVATITNTLSLTKASGTGLAVTANATVGGDLTITGAMKPNGALDSTGNVTLANGSGKTIQLGASGTSASTVVTTVYGKTIFNGEVSTLGGITSVTGNVNFTGASAFTFTDASSNGVLTLSASSGTSLDIAADANIDGILDVGTLRLATGYNISYSSSQILLNNDTKIDGDLEVTGELAYGSAVYQTQQISDYFQINSGAEYRAQGVSLITIPTGAWDITGKSVIYINDSSGGTVTIGSVTGTNNQIIHVFNLGTTGLQIPIGNMHTGAAYTIAAKKGAILQWDDNNSKFYVFASLS